MHRQLRNFAQPSKDQTSVLSRFRFSHPGHDIHMSQAKCGGAVLSFSLASKDDLMSFTRRVKIPILAVSLGGVESIFYLILQRCLMLA